MLTPALHSAMYKACIGFNQILALIAMGAEAIAELIAGRGENIPLAESEAPWLIVAGLRAKQSRADVRRLFPADYSGSTIT